MYILSATELKEWDAYTISHEPILSIDLMERAASKCADWIMAREWQSLPFHIFCGKGNNGGDGLAIARMLLQQGYQVAVHILEHGKPGSADFQTNLQRLHEFPGVNIQFLQASTHFPEITRASIIIDALFGYGLNKPPEGLAAELIQHINNSGALVVSIDLPSGLHPDASSAGHQVIRAHYTLTFESYKLALLMQDNAACIGEVFVLPIGLHPGYTDGRSFELELLSFGYVKQLFRKRNPFAHKGHFGHALLLAGSYGKMGAAVLAARTCIHSGAGLLTCYLPACGYGIMQSTVPEAMVLTDENPHMLTQLPEGIEKYSAIGIGPGIGTSDATQKLFSFIVRRYKKPLVIDADGLNCLSLHPELLEQLPSFSILTPHPKEFDRLFGNHTSDFDRMATARKKSKELKLVIVLKGHHTLIAMPGGSAWFNSSGNAGMAKGGSGDVLTGLITGLLAQGYEPVAASLLGVYLHGFAGDLAAAALGENFMSAGNLIDFLSPAFMQTSGA